MADPCDVSVIIPVFNEAQNLGQLLDRLKSVRLSAAEVIVVDDGSTDASAEIAENNSETDADNQGRSASKLSTTI